MSGRPKNPVTDAEQLRLLTREAHEAIQGLREVLRELRAEHEAIRRARAEHAGFLDESIGLACAAAEEQIRGYGTLCLEELKFELDKVQSYIARMLGAGSITELANVITQDAAQELAKILRPEIEAGMLRLVPDPARLASQRRRELEDAGVYVVTDPADVPADTDLVIDAREPGGLRFDRPVRFT